MDTKVTFSKIGITGVLVSVLLIISLVTFFSPQARRGLRRLFVPADRKILSVAHGPIFPEAEGRVLKLATPEGLVLEIYGPLQNGLETILDTISLADRRDAYFQFQGRASNLALKDLDNDSVFEIIAPSYDASLVPHLNIFRYNRDSRKFEPYEPPVPGL